MVTFKNSEVYDNKRKMFEKSKLVKILGMGLIATTIASYPSQSYETISHFYSGLIQQEIVIKEKSPARIRGEYLQKKIEEENLNTGKFSSEQVVEMLEGSIQKAGGLPEYIDEGFVYSLVDKESKWDANAESDRGANGLGQLTPATWKDYNPKISYNKVYDPETNLETVIKTLNGHEKYFEKEHPAWDILSEKEKLKIHAAAYNWGKGNLRRIGWDLTKKRKVPYQTRVHVKEILETYDFISS